MFGCEISSLEQRLFSLPVRLGGLGLDLPTVSANSLYAASRHATEVIVSAITVATPFEISVHDDLVFVAQRHYQKQLDAMQEALFSEVCLGLDPIHLYMLLNVLGLMIYQYGCLLCPLRRTIVI